MTMKWLRLSCLAAVVGTAVALAVTRSAPVMAQSGDAQKGGAIAWNSSFAAAQKTAAREKKALLVDFGATWCGPCKEMLRTTYKDSAVVARARAFVPVQVDIDKSPELAKKYKVDAIPVVLFLSAQGKVLGRGDGYIPAPNVIKLMDQASKKAKS